MSEEFKKLLNIEAFIEVIKDYINQEVIEFELYKSMFYTDGISIRIKCSNYDYYIFEDIESNEFENLEFYSIIDILQDFKIYARNKKIKSL